MYYLQVIAVLGVVLLHPSLAPASTTDDVYIAGYAAGVLKQSLKLDMPSLTVRDGVITLPVAGLKADERAKAVPLLTEIPGVHAVMTSETAVPQPGEASARFSQIPGEATVPATGSVILPTGLLPAGHLFKPLLADPRWARFSAAYRNYQSDNFDGNDIGSVSFGETIPFYRSHFGRSAAQWETGLQAGVFSDFNLNASSSDLVNTDFIVSLYGSARAGQFSAFGRLYHQSSHLGDEFLLRKIDTKFERVNLSSDSKYFYRT
jgi:hypothetical protein